MIVPRFMHHANAPERTAYTAEFTCRRLRATSHQTSNPITITTTKAMRSIQGTAATRIDNDGLQCPRTVVHRFGVHRDGPGHPAPRSNGDDTRDFHRGSRSTSGSTSGAGVPLTTPNNAAAVDASVPAPGAPPGGRAGSRRRAPAGRIQTDSSRRCRSVRFVTSAAGVSSPATRTLIRVPRRRSTASADPGRR